MARRYSISTNDTNTAATTLVCLTSAATVRPCIYDIVIGSDATPADNACKFAFQRFTAAGTSTSYTPVALDPGDPASLAAAGFNHSVEPTYTANAYLLFLTANQRATVRWVAAPGSELKCPATAANGIGMTALVVGGSSVNTVSTLLFEE